MPARGGPVRSARIRRLGIQSVVIEGDSITELQPYTYEATKYSWLYALSRPEKTWHITAHISRQVGALADLNNGSNEMMGHIGEDNSYGPQLITAKMGANDLALATDTTVYRQNLIDYKKQVNALGIKFIWSGPISYNPTGTTHPQYANFMANRANIYTNARDPNVWGQYADYYMPMGEIPDFNDTAAAPLFGDTVHPSASGQQLLLNCYKAVMDTILTPGLEFSKQPDPGIWPKSQTNLAVSTTYVDRFVIKGIAHKGLASGISINPGTSGAQIRLNGTDNPSYAGFGGAYGTTFGPIYNGDVIDVKYTTNAANDTPISFDLTIGAETRTITKRTVIAVTPADYVSGGAVQGRNTTSSATFTTAAFAFQVGTAVITIATPGTAAPTSVLIKGAGAAGADIAASSQIASTGSGHIEIWTAQLPTAGNFAVAVTPGASGNAIVVAAGTAINADPTPVAVVQSAPNESDPHLLPSVTIPASGILLAAFNESGGLTMTPAVANNGTQVVEGNVTNTGNSATRGILLSKNSTSGAVQASFNFGFGQWSRVGILFKALGT